MKSLLAGVFLFLFSIAAAIECETIFGKMEINEPVLVELIESRAVQRLKKVDQHGHISLQKKRPSFSRYDHSIGVLYLLRHFKAPLKVQVAGLLHDVSHTAFSHVGNLVFDHIDGKDSYQDTIHEWHMRNNGIEPILQKHKISISDACNLTGYPLLEQDLPEISLHRLEYNLHTAYSYGFLTTAEIKTLVDDVEYKEGKWFFKNLESAKKVANFSLYFTENLWGADWNAASQIMLSKAIKRGLEIGTITSSELHHCIDTKILKKLEETSDHIVQRHLKTSASASAPPHTAKKGKQVHTTPKFRGINPWVEREGKLVRLCDAEVEYAKEYNRVRLKMAQGYFFSF